MGLRNVTAEQKKMANHALENIGLLSNFLTKREYKGPSSQFHLARSVTDGTTTPDRFPGLNLLQTRIKAQEPSETVYLANGAFASLVEAQSSVDTGPYVDILDHEALIKADARKEIEKKETDPTFQQHVSCALTDDDLLTLVLVFVSWTGMDPEGVSPDELEYRDWTPDEMQNELLKVRAFLRTDLNRTLCLTGSMAKINETMFMSELEQFTEDELMAYGVLFHFDFEPLQFTQESLANSYAALQESGASAADLEEQQRKNEKIFVQELRALILENKVWMMERLRLWKWREEVFLGRIEESLEEYPGVQLVLEFESTAELLDAGMDSYFLRVGEAKREELIDRFFFFDLFHMAGMLASGVGQDVEFKTNMLHEDLADLIITLLEELEIDPRHILTPLSIQSIINKERTEVTLNLYRKHKDYDEETLLLACSHAGIETGKSTNVERADGTVVIERQTKPHFVLIEELASQYLSPQFYTAVEYHRYYLAALNGFATLSGGNVTQGDDGDFLFFGVGDGLSVYRVYRPLELATVFDATGDFIDPYSRRDHPHNPLKWSRFSLPCIQRLILIVLPQLKLKSKATNPLFAPTSPPLVRKDENSPGKDRGSAKRRSDIDFLEQSIIAVFNRLDTAPSSFLLDGVSEVARLEKKFGAELFKSQSMQALLEIEQAMDPKQTQARIIGILRDHLDEIREPLMGFFAYLFQLGVQFSDWDTAMIRIDEASLDAGIKGDDIWRHVDPETTSNLTDKIFNMLTVETERYFKIIGSDGEDYTPYVKSLRFVRHYAGAYRIDWYDELANIDGLLYLMTEANNVSYYHHLQTCGNWLMTTANYYSVAIADQAIGDNEIEVLGKPLHPGRVV